MKRALLVVLIVISAITTTHSDGRSSALTPKLQKIADGVERAHRSGDLGATWKALSPAIAIQSTPQAEAFDTRLADKGLPSVRDLLFEIRFKFLIEERKDSAPKLSTKERLLLLEGFENYIQTALVNDFDSVIADSKKTPADMDAFDRRFTSLQERRSRLRLTEKAAVHAGQLADGIPSSARSRLSDREIKLLAVGDDSTVKRVQELAQKFDELELETRLERLEYGLSVLAGKELTKEKFIAAASTRQDARLLLEALEPKPSKSGSGAKQPAGGATRPTFQSEVLNRPELVDQVKDMQSRAASLAGPLGPRAESFFTGLEFWLRGRYGFGPDVGGLAKSPAALDSPKILYQVSMPEGLLTRNQKSSPDQPPLVYPERRHHFTWSWEDRRLTTSETKPVWSYEIGTADYVKVSKRAGVSDPRWADQERFMGSAYWDRLEWTKTVSVPPQDPRLIWRLVGFVEYGEALQHLDGFVAEASKAEFRIAEEIVGSNDIFAINVNLAQTVENPIPAVSGSDAPRTTRAGLEWMLALARVELGAMLAGFTSHTDPFLSLAPRTLRKGNEDPRPFGEGAFAELLNDGLRSHFGALRREDIINNYYKSGIPENHLLTYGRRVIVAQQFLRAVLRWSPASRVAGLTPARRTELNQWNEMSQKIMRMLLYCLSQKTGQEKNVLSRFMAAGVEERGIASERSPQSIKKLLETLDPSLVACPCR